ncbi:MAG: hypothetical protein PHE27_09050, partial [Alphaproteobacteria bacterium]|nr:hypothetical protein [Alphaproteobacteria bacterium]
YEHPAANNGVTQISSFNITVAPISVCESKRKLNAKIADENTQFDLIKACKDAGNELVKVGPVMISPRNVKSCKRKGLLRRKIVVQFKDNSKWTVPNKTPMCELRDLLCAICPAKTATPAPKLD